MASGIIMRANKLSKGVSKRGGDEDEANEAR